ncbi:MAG: hypothetical protein Q7R95_02345 [bacterium]|nr:hypothetical protein [bacterium]
MKDEDLDNLFDTPDQPTKPDNLENSAIIGQPKKNRNKSELTNEQTLKILKIWQERLEDPPSIEEILKEIFPDQSFDGRSVEGFWVKSLLANQNLPAPTNKTDYKPKGLLPLSDEFKQYIKVNTNMTGNEIACVLFEKQFLANTSQEVRTILSYKKELENTGEYKSEVKDEEVSEEYRPPKTLDHVCARINRNVDGVDYDSKKLTPTQKKQCMTLISYMHSFRFSHHFNLINNNDDKRLFENTFIKYIYNKIDLSQEDLDQYLALGNEAVMESGIKRTIAMLENEQEKSISTDGKISMAIVEALKTSRDELNACRNRHDKLYKALDLERSKKMDGKLKDNATVLNLVEAWKQKDQRDKMIQLANKRKEKLSNEIDKLENMDELKVRILGISKDEILEG